MQILKIGGSCMKNSMANLIPIIDRLKNEEPLICVHGYGAELSGLLQQNGIERHTFISLSGIHSHFTDELCAAASVFAAALCRHRLVAALQLSGHVVNASAAHVNGFAVGKQKKLRYLDEKQVVRSRTDDYAGTIIDLNFSALPIEEVDMVLLSPIISDQSGKQLVVDADKLAVEIALACDNSQLVLLSDVPGLQVNGSYVRKVNFADLPKLICSTEGGMQRKLRHIQHALKNGVSQVSIMDGTNSISISDNGTTFYAEK